METARSTLDVHFHFFKQKKFAMIKRAERRAQRAAAAVPISKPPEKKK